MEKELINPLINLDNLFGMEYWEKDFIHPSVILGFGIQDPCRCGTDPDRWIRTTRFRIRILLFFLATFKKEVIF
jgi:hypothetical protein